MWNFNPLASLMRRSKTRNSRAFFRTLNARILRSSLSTKFKDNFLLNFGSDPVISFFTGDSGLYFDVFAGQMGLFDYATLMVPRFISGLLWYLQARLIEKLSHLDNGIGFAPTLALSIIVFLPVFLAFILIPIAISRLIFSAIMTVVTSPLILITHFISSLVAKPLKQKVQKVCGDMDLDAIAVIKVERGQERTNIEAKVIFRIADKTLLKRLLSDDYFLGVEKKELIFKDLSTFKAFCQLNVGNVNAVIAKKIKKDTPDEKALRRDVGRLLFFKNNKEQNFSKLPKEVIVKIASETRGPSIPTEDDAVRIVRKWF